MRILVCASDAPVAPLNGMRLQVRALVEQLAERHEVCVLAPRWPGQDGPAPRGVELIAIPAPPLGPAARFRDRAVSLARREPVDAARLARPVARSAGVLLARRGFDVVHVGLGELAGIAHALGGVPAVLAPLDAWSLNAATAEEAATGPRRTWLGVQRRLVVRHVAHAYRPFARIVLVSVEDAAETERLDPALRTAVIPNGVDADRFLPDPTVPRDDRLLVFTGALHTPPNVAAAVALATEVLPAVRGRLPDTRLALVGRDPSRAVRALAALPGVDVAADVPDVRPWLTRAGAFACAMTSGTGIKNKLLEAMACGAPCVATPLACRGLGTPGDAIVRADPGPAFAAATADLLADRARAARLGARAREHVVAHHTWAAVARAYEAVYAEAVASAANSGG